MRSQWTDVKGMLWAVSQAAPLRRVLVTNNLKLYEYRNGGAAGYASGGYLGNSVVHGIVASGSCRHPCQGDQRPSLSRPKTHCPPSPPPWILECAWWKWTLRH